MGEAILSRDYYSVGCVGLGNMRGPEPYCNCVDGRPKKLKYSALDYATKWYRSAYYREHLFELDEYVPLPVPTKGSVVVLGMRNSFDPAQTNVTLKGLMGYEYMGVYLVTDEYPNAISAVDCTTGRRKHISKGDFNGRCMYSEISCPIEECEAYYTEHKDEFVAKFHKMSMELKARRKRDGNR